MLLYFLQLLSRVSGGVSERLKVTVLKTVEPERVPWVRIPPPPPDHPLPCGELAESVEGARLLSEYTGQNLYRGFESLALRQRVNQRAFALIAQPDRVFGYEPKGRRFESCWAHHKKAGVLLKSKASIFFYNLISCPNLVQTLKMAPSPNQAGGHFYLMFYC